MIKIGNVGDQFIKAVGGLGSSPNTESTPVGGTNVPFYYNPLKQTKNPVGADPFGAGATSTQGGPVAKGQIARMEKLGEQGKKWEEYGKFKPDVGEQQQQAGTLAQDIATKYGAAATQGIASAQAMQAPMLPATQTAAGVAPLTLEERVTAAQIAPSATAKAAQVGPATTIAPGFQQYIAGLTPEQIQAVELERTQAAGPAQIQVSDQGRAFQQALAQQLMGQVTGTAPSLAEMQLKDAQERALKQQIAQAVSVRGGPAAAAQQRQLGAQLAETQQAQLAEAAQARIKEQQAAQQLLGQAATQMRTADVEIATEQARLQQQAALEGRKLTSEEARVQAGFKQEAKKSNQQAINDLTAQKADLTLKAQQGDQQAANQLKEVQAKLDTEVNLDNARRLDDIAIQQAVLEQQAAQGNQQAAVDLQKLNAQLQVDVQKFNASEANEMAKADQATKTEYDKMKNDMIQYYTTLGYTAEQAEVKTMLDIAGQKITAASEKSKAELGRLEQGREIVSGIGSAIGAAAMMASDINVKTNIKEANLLKDLAKAKPYEYDYKDTKYGSGKHHSLMAQDIEKIPFLQKIVVEKDNVKMVDYAKALPSMLAAQAEMAKEILELKKKRGK